MFADSFEVSLYFLDVVSPCDSFVYVWTFNCYVKDAAAVRAEEVVVEFVVDVVSVF